MRLIIHLLFLGFFVCVSSVLSNEVICNDGVRVTQDGCDIVFNDCLFSGLQSVGSDSNAYSDEGNGNGGAIFTQRSSPGTVPWGGTIAYLPNGCRGEWFFRIFLSQVRFEKCFARVSGGAIYVVAQAEDINETIFVNCSSGVTAGSAYIQAVGFPGIQEPLLGWTQMNASIIESSYSPDSSLRIFCAIHETLPLSSGSSVSFDRDQDLTVWEFNATANAVEAYGAAFYLWQQRRIYLNFCRFFDNVGQNLVRIGVTIWESPPLSCTFFVNNTIIPNDDVRGIIYLEYHYVIEDAVFLKNKADWYFVVTSETTFRDCAQVCGDSPYIYGQENLFNCVASCSDNTAQNYLILINCIFDTIGGLTGDVQTYNCSSSFNDELPNECHFVYPSALPSVSPLPTSTPIPPVTETPVATVTETPVATVTETPVATVTETPVATVTETPIETVTAPPIATSHPFNTSKTLVVVAPPETGARAGGAAVVGAAAGSVGGTLAIAGLALLALFLFKRKKPVPDLPDEADFNGDTVDLEELETEDAPDYVSEYGLSNGLEESGGPNGDDEVFSANPDEMEGSDVYVSERNCDGSDSMKLGSDQE